MEVQFSISYKEQFGYKVKCGLTKNSYRYGYDFLFCDSKWIGNCKVEKQYYIKHLISEYNAVNYGTQEFPSIYFKTMQDAEKAKEDFYEPLIMALKMIA